MRQWPRLISEYARRGVVSFYSAANLLPFRTHCSPLHATSQVEVFYQQEADDLQQSSGWLARPLKLITSLWPSEVALIEPGIDHDIASVQHTKQTHPFIDASGRLGYEIHHGV
jgi:hypothetical protein